MAERYDDRSLKDLFAELSRETGLLVRKEYELAVTELSAKARAAAADAGMVAGGAALAHGGMLVLLAAVVLVLVRVGVAPWLAAFIVAILALGVGYMFANRGVTHLKRINPTPGKTVETLKETAAWTTGQRA
jgi:hypothetical protein